MKSKLQVLDNELSIYQLSADTPPPSSLFEQEFYSLTRSDSELSFVAPSHFKVSGAQIEPGWRAIKILGTLDFSLTGVIADLSTVLARAQISIFTISTYETDIVLFKKENLTKAVDSLRRASYTFVEKP